MVNARQAALRDRRSTTKRKVLRPGSLSSASDSIARKMADAQFESMVKRYNDGVVSNEEMYSYLQSASSNPFFTEMDKVNINDKLRDFEVAVNGEHLEANFQSTEGAEKITAARALAAYYNERANNLESGTPAHSKALQDVANWKGKAETVYEGLKKEERKMARAQAEYELSRLPPGVENLKMQVESFEKLALEAQEDGEMIDAMEWATKANEIRTTDLPEAIADEASDEVTERLNIVKSEYERGYITASNARIELDAIDQLAQEHGLWNKMSDIDTFTEKLGQDVVKGTSIEEFEGRSYTIRQADGSELTTSIKDQKAQWQEEDDRFRAMLYDSGQDQSEVEKYENFVYLYAVYLNGGGNEDTGQFFGLKNRRDQYSSWAEQVPDKAYGYEESARNIDAQVTTKTDKLSQYIRTLSSYAGDTNESVNQLLGAVTELYSGEPVNFEGRQATGLLITKDKDGFEQQKFVPLNTEVEIVDENGNTTLINTKVGSSIGKVPGEHNTYVQLEPIYLAQGDIPGKYYTYSVGEYHGELFIQSKYDLEGELVKASELAKTNLDIRSWYESPDQRTGVTKKDQEAQRMQEYFNNLSPEEKQIKQDETDARTAAETAAKETDQGLGKDLTPIDRYPDLPQFPGVDADRGSPPLDLSTFKDIRFDQQHFQPSYGTGDPITYPGFQSSYAPTSYTPSTQNFGTQLTSPEEYKPLPFSGFTMNLPQDNWKMPESKMFTGPTVKEVVSNVGNTIGSAYNTVKDTVKSGVSNVSNWLKKIKLPWSN